MKDGKMGRFCPSRGFILDLEGMGVCCSIFFCPRLQSWTKQMENLDPSSPHPPPKSRMERRRVFALRAASSLTWGDEGLLFHFILSKIVDPRGNEFVRAHYVIAGRWRMYYIINSKRRRKRHKYVTNQRNVKNLAESGYTGYTGYKWVYRVYRVYMSMDILLLLYETVGLFGVIVTWKNNQCLWNWKPRLEELVAFFLQVSFEGQRSEVTGYRSQVTDKVGRRNLNLVIQCCKNTVAVAFLRISCGISSKFVLYWYLFTLRNKRRDVVTKAVSFR